VRPTNAQDLTLAKGIVSANGLDRQVRVFPNFPLKEKADVFAMSDILLSPVDNTQETFGLSLLEGMAAGLPVIASRFDGYKDLVEDGVDGWLVDTWWSDRDPMEEWFDLLDPDISQLFQAQGVAIDQEQLADRLLDLIASRARRAEMGRAGRAKVQRQYRWSRVIPRYQEAWARLRQAAAGPGRHRGPATNPYCLGPNRVFGGYASRLLEPGTIVRATAPVLDEAPYRETAVVLDPEVCQRMIQVAEVPRRVDELVAAAAVDPDRGWYAVQWLMKYGFLAVAQPARPDRA